MLFIGYEGFGIITNTAGNMNNPQKSVPIALYSAVLIVMAIYLAVSITVVGNLTISEISVSKDFALAVAAKPFLGNFGFKLISIAALFSTASAINATLFGAANICYTVAREGELPSYFTRTKWKNATGGLLITSLLVIVFILFFDLAGVTMMGSGAFLLIYASVNAGHLRILDKTHANKTVVIISLILCLLLFIVLEIYTFRQSPSAIYTMIAILAGSFVLERVFYFRRK